MVDVSILLHFLLLAALHGLTRAQTFVPNPAWRDTEIKLSTDERITIAKDGIEKTLSMMVNETGKLQLEDGNYGAMGNFFSQIAQFDMFANQTTYKNRLLDFFSQALLFRPGFMQGNAHSIAAIQAYKAYNDSSFLDWAEIAWSGGESYTLTEDKVRTEKISGKNITIPAICSNLTMSGGTFEDNNPNTVYVSSLATGASSTLAEATPNQTYLNYARNSREFYGNQLQNARGDLLDGIGVDQCDPSGGTYPANAGIMMEGLAALMSVVSKSDGVEQDLIEIVNKTVSNTGWHLSDGILRADSKIQASDELVGQYIVRGLSAVYNRNMTESSLRTYAREYLGVQACLSASEPGYTY
ncbi:hypothetical protein V5O48_010230 [Marasmius crinis-equi]|uniref:Uncharacterized protein n=1 Tax=Marasmius crinis-equi TaxID=585013 RepID=A0ABR3F8X2_9AGAR